MLDKFIFNEDIKRVFNTMSNTQIISQFILKDYLTDVKVINDTKKTEKITENLTNLNSNNSKSTGRYNDSSQNLITFNNQISKNNNSIYPITNANNSFLYLNSSFKSLHFDKLEGIIFECKWKKKFILLFRIKSINDFKKDFKYMEIECIEMNHYENAFNLEFSMFWNSTEFQTIFLFKFIPKDKVIEEIINREFNNEDRKKIYENISNYLYNDLTNIEHCATSIIFGNMKDISLYLSDAKKLLQLGPVLDHHRLEVYNSNLISTGQNCRVYDNKTGNLCQEFIFSEYYIKKNSACQIKWEKKLDNKLYCIYRLFIIYLEENISLMIFRNIWHQHVPSKLLYEVNSRKNILFDDVRNYFLKKNKLNKYESYFNKNIKEISLKVGVRNSQKEKDNQLDLDEMIHNNSIFKNIDIKDKNKEQDSQYDSLFLNNSGFNNSNFEVKNGDNLFTDTIQNISEIQNINSNFLGIEDDN